MKKCLYCKKEFKPPKYYEQKKFCSHSCRGKYHYKNGINIPPTRHNKSPWNKGLTKNDDERLMAMAVNRTGKKNWQWTGKDNQRFRDKIKRDLIKWRVHIFKRDNWTCQDCGKHGGKLHPHHIKQMSKFPELSLNVGNGITLCEECHKERHKKS
jgi:5-methylcytosine-specific restriction endonuclease McrA